MALHVVKNDDSDGDVGDNVDVAYPDYKSGNTDGYAQLDTFLQRGDALYEQIEGIHEDPMITENRTQIRKSAFRTLGAGVLALGLSLGAGYNSLKASQSEASKANSPTADLVSGTTPTTPIANAKVNLVVPEAKPAIETMPQYVPENIKTYTIIHVHNIREAIAKGYIVTDDEGYTYPANGLDFKDKESLDINNPETYTLIRINTTL